MTKINKDVKISNLEVQKYVDYVILYEQKCLHNMILIKYFTFLTYEKRLHREHNNNSPCEGLLMRGNITYIVLYSDELKRCVCPVP